MIYLAQFEWRNTGPGYAWTGPDGFTGVLDLRPLPAQGRSGGSAEGYALFSHDDANLPGATPIADSIHGSFDKRSLEHAFGISLDGSTAAECAWELLTWQADPSGATAAMPLTPDSHGRLELYFAGERLQSKRLSVSEPEWAAVQAVYQNAYRIAEHNVKRGAASPNLHQKMLSVFMAKCGTNDPTLFIPRDLDQRVRPLPPTTILTDDFNRADQSGLGSSSEGWSWSGGTTNFDILTNRGRIKGGSNSGARAESDLSSADMYAQFTFVQAVGANYHGTAVRYDSGAETFYTYFAFGSGTDDRLAKNVGGSRTDLATGANTYADSDVIKTECNGTAIKGYMNGVEKQSVTDSAISSNTRAGIAALSVGSSDIIDVWSASDLVVTDHKPLTLLGVG